jgi:uncharacterized protein (TIGR03790 family)
LSRAIFHGKSVCGKASALLAVVAWVLAALLSVRAEDASPPTNAAPAAPAAALPGLEPPQPSWTFHPLVLTNLTSGPFPESHPELAPEPGVHPGLSLQTNGVSASEPDFTSADGGLLAGAFHRPSSSSWTNDLAAHLLVVYNSADPDSKTLADYYAAKRNIPPERVLAIVCPTTEEISRKQYDETIRGPIVTYLSVKDWLVREPKEVEVADRMLNLLVATRNDIWAIVLMRGVPLKIAADPDDYYGMEAKPELETNAAAVDNELALLPIFGLPLGGFVPNIFYDGLPNGIKTIGPDLARNMILVTRLDGPTPADVRRMIDDTLYAEQHRLAGLAVVDTRGLTDEKDGYTSGDDWLRGARDALVKDGWTVKFDDKPDLIPPTDPCNQVALYLGWYGGQAYGPFFAPPARFVPGAIAYHLHSFSANTVRSDTANWVGPFIAHGAAATMGMVYEPYLALTPHEDIFARRLVAGGYFAEAAYASERGLSWMLTVVGDPLYRPFRATIDDALAESSPDGDTAHADWLHLQKVQRGVELGVIPPDPARIEAEIEVPGAGPVAIEGLGDFLLGLKSPNAGVEAERAYRKAAVAEIAPIDRIRLALKLANYYSTHGESAHAQAELDNMRDLFPADASRFGVPNTLVPTSIPPANPSPPPNAPPQLPQLPQLPKPTPAP